MLNIKIIAIGKLRDQTINDLVDEYAKRIKPFARLDIIELPETSFTLSGAAAAKEKEGDRIIKVLERFQDSFIIAMDENGVEHDSVAFSRYLEKQNLPVVMVIGGSLGLSKKVLEACHAKLALSRLTFTHGLARLFLLEQIYRATTIIGGKAYHH